MAPKCKYYPLLLQLPIAHYDLAVQRREPPGKLHKDQKWTAPACVTITHFTSWFSPIQIGHYSVFHLPVSFSTANPGSLIQVLNRTIPQKPLNLLAFFSMSQLSHDPRARIIANGTTWTKATSAKQMANASTAELTVMTGYSSKAEAGLQPICSEFNTIPHRGCPPGQFLFCTKRRLPNSFLCPDSPCLSMSYINLYHQGTIIYT